MSRIDQRLVFAHDFVSVMQQDGEVNNSALGVFTPGSLYVNDSKQRSKIETTMERGVAI